MSRVSDVNTTGRARRNKLDSDGLCHNVAFVADDVRHVTTVIESSTPGGGAMRRALASRVLLRLPWRRTDEVQKQFALDSIFGNYLDADRTSGH